jgi:hypothetical protein
MDKLIELLLEVDLPINEGISRKAEEKEES